MDLSKKIISLPIQTQYFPFLPNFMKYILQNSSPKLLLKLYQCCKYFYFKSKITIAPDLSYTNNPKEKEIHFMFFDENEKAFYYRSFPIVERLWLCDMLRIYSGDYGYGKIGNVFLNKIYRNTLKKLSICSGFTLFKELEILSKSPNLTEIILQTFVKNENDEPIPIEEIIVLFPNIKEFGISPSNFTMGSFNKLLEFKFSNKFEKLYFELVKNEFDPISFCKFLHKNFDGNTRFSLTFDSYDCKLQLLPRVKEIIYGWKTNKPKCFYHQM